MSPDLVEYDRPAGCWPLVLLCEDTVGSTLGWHLIHLRLREPPESAPNKQLGESEDGKGGEERAEGKEGEGEGRKGRKEKGGQENVRRQRGEENKCFFKLKNKSIAVRDCGWRGSERKGEKEKGERETNALVSMLAWGTVIIL